MAELLLIENPRRKHPPMIDSAEVLQNRRINVARRRHNRRSGVAAIRGTYKEWTQGVDMMDAAGAVGGLAASTMLPGMLIKDSSTTANKLLKVGVALLGAIGAGAIGKSFVSPSVGKAAVIGGLAGTTAAVIAMLTGFQIGKGSPTLSLPRGRRIGEHQVVSPPFSRESETVGIITP